MRHVADRTPDRGKERERHRYFADGAGCLHVGNDQAVLAHSGLVVARSQIPRPATRSELTRTRGYDQCFLDLSQSTRDFGPYADSCTAADNALIIVAAARLSANGEHGKCAIERHAASLMTGVPLDIGAWSLSSSVHTLLMDRYRQVAARRGATFPSLGKGPGGQF